MQDKGINKFQFVVSIEEIFPFCTRQPKYTFLVMSFGPTNAPSFYSAMMKNFEDK